MIKRHLNILDLARRDGEVSVERLATSFGVTLQTIRRDLVILAQQGRLERIHGGAVLPSGLRNIGYEHRRRLNDDAKTRIGIACANEVTNGSTVFLGIGTTCEAVARALIHREGLLIMTNNLNAIPTLSAGGKNTVLVTGGRLRDADAGLIGAATVTSVRQLKFDLAIIGCSALDEEGDVFDYDLDEVMVSQAVIETSRKTILVADNAKFARQAPARIAPLSEISLFCTDQPPHQLHPAAVGTGPNLLIAAK
ncbi:DeoR/GlpR family DNA-binding transcription regulator [Octadecabacter sp.]|nr:DeoR/GlpR family DNA-binding transcription regulator [Octadecabacter sp.]